MAIDLKKLADLLDEGLASTRLRENGRFKGDLWRQLVKPVTEPFLEAIRQQLLPHIGKGLLELKDKGIGQKQMPNTLHELACKIPQEFDLQRPDAKQFGAASPGLKVLVGSTIQPDGTDLQHRLCWGVTWWGRQSQASAVAEAYRQLRIGEEVGGFAIATGKQSNFDGWSAIVYKSLGPAEIRNSDPTILVNQIAGDLSKLYKDMMTKKEEFARLVAAERELKGASRSWIFQSNPDRFNLRGALASGSLATWLAVQSSAKMAQGDRVFLWETGKDGGLLAAAEITSAPSQQSIPDRELPFLLDPSIRESALRVGLRIRRHLNNPISPAVLVQHPLLAEMPFMKARQGTNWEIEEADAEALQEMIEEKPIPRALKIAPGEGGKWWDDCHSQSVICLGWPKLGDLKAFPDQKALEEAMSKNYLERYKGHVGTVKSKGAEVWKFFNLREGDYVVANKGMSRVFAVGRVVKPGYAFRPEWKDHPHTISVEWDEGRRCEFQPPQQGWVFHTVEECPSPLFRSILLRKGVNDWDGGEGGERNVDPEPNPPQGTLREFMTALLKGPPPLFFSREAVSDLLLALQAKRFVLLTGISGTGKTQLAMAVARRVSGSTDSGKELDSDGESGTAIQVAPYMVKYSRLVLPARLSDLLVLPEKPEDPREWKIHVRCPGGSADQRLTPHVGDGRPILLFSGEVGRWLREEVAAGDTLMAEPIHGDTGSDGIALSIVSSGEVTRKSDSLAVIAVRPDWTDNRGLLGYYNPLLKSYSSTPFLSLLLRAAADVEQAKREDRAASPFFAILDEMNLARVEHYFSDFLSALESGEPVHLHDDPAVEAAEVAEGDAVPRNLRVPENVFFIGTVNIDETTHMFSPKVLDRAFVIELNDVELKALAEMEDGVPEEEDDGFQLRSVPDPFLPRPRPTAVDWQTLSSVENGDPAKRVLQVNDILGAENRHFGYRVANEIARYILLAREQAGDEPAVIDAALDLALLHKVLPRLHGTQQELESVLLHLFEFCVNGSSGSEAEPGVADPSRWQLTNDGIQWKPTATGEESPVPVLRRCALKLFRMLTRLRQRGFTSYIE